MDSESPVEATPASACVPWSRQPLHDLKMYRIGIWFILLVAVGAAHVAALLVVGWIVMPEWRATVKAAMAEICDRPLVPCPIVDAFLESDDRILAIDGRHLDLAIQFHVRLPVFEPTPEPPDDCDGEDDDCDGPPEADYMPTKAGTWTCLAHGDSPPSVDKADMNFPFGSSGPMFDYVRWNAVPRISNPTRVPP